MDIDRLIRDYGEDDRKRIACRPVETEGGKEDPNEEMRTRLMRAVLAAPEAASPALLGDLLRAEARWARATYGTAEGFEDLAQLTLDRGGEEALEAFLESLAESFDTFCACSTVELEPGRAAELAAVCRKRMAAADEEETRGLYQAGADFFDKLGA